MWPLEAAGCAFLAILLIVSIFEFDRAKDPAEQARWEKIMIVSLSATSVLLGLSNSKLLKEVGVWGPGAWSGLVKT